ncbi:hypothetical protein MIND_01280300 [Mycena indigotica]|uniref:Uncharacterized protein n=1 Tax=Mycena indigotica TaxID=2126181 RepID=A0A8H6S2A1_9AGAR|nr:uncharacterized protein MIND_01280300 [Mycena indigotica]KAF7291358.1 hypothetical protein MIND_01280300 [Mycena indigotica]
MPPPNSKRSRRRSCKAFALFLAARALPCAHAQANRTLDDFSPALVYTPATPPALVRGALAGFNVSELYNGTVAVLNATAAPGHSVNMSVKFTGTEIYVFLAKPQNASAGAYGIAYNVYLDGAQVDQVGSFDQDTDAEYAQEGYTNSNLNLTLKAHTLVFEATDGAVYLDYVVFRSNNPTPETSIAPIKALPSPSSAAPSGSAAATGTKSRPGETPLASAVAERKRSRVPLIAGAAAAVLCLLGAGVAACICLRRRNARRPAAAVLPGGPGPYPAMSQSLSYAGGQVYASDAALVGSQHSVSAHGHAPYGYTDAPPPLPSQQHNLYQHPPHLQPQAYDSPMPNLYLSPPAQPQPMTYPPAPSPVSPPLTSPSAYSPVSPSDTYAYAPPTPTAYDPRGAATLAYTPSQSSHSSRSAYDERARILAEQRRIEAEYERPGWASLSGAEEKRRLREHEERLGVANPGPLSPASPASSSAGMQRSWSTRTGTSGSGAGAEDISHIAAEMHALRAQVARLEGERLEREGRPAAGV